MTEKDKILLQNDTLNNVKNCDVLIIGGGGAALRAALEAYETDPTSRIYLVTKGKLGEDATTANAYSDRVAFHATLPFTEPGGEDNWKYHTADIYEGGGFSSDEDLAQILAKESKEAFEYLGKIGVKWVTKNGKVVQENTDYATYPRACYTGSDTSRCIEQALIRKLKLTPIKIYENVFIIDLISISKGGEVIGAVGLDVSNNLIFFETKSIILATGGAGRAFKYNVLRPEITGDGYAMAYRAGAKLVNLEFINIGICLVKEKFTCTATMMQALPRLVNDRDEEFLFNYLPFLSKEEGYSLLFEKGISWPMAAEHKSCLIDIICFKEMMKGRKIYLDYNFNNLDLKKIVPAKKWYEEKAKLAINEDIRWNPLVRLKTLNPGVVDWLKKKGSNLTRDGKLEIVPAVQHFLGGVKMGRDAQTSLKGLFVAGECAGGQHGSTRPGGNALLDTQVFGRIAGRNAVNESKKRTHTPITLSLMKEIQEKLSQVLQGKIKASLIREEIESLAMENCSVIRTEARIDKLINRLEELKSAGIKIDENGPKFAFETLNVLTVIQLIANAVKMRKESRGTHLYFQKFEDIEPLKRNDKVYAKKYIVQYISEKGERKIEIVPVKTLL